MKTKLIVIFVILLSFFSIQSFVYAEEGTSTDSTWTDFSKAKYEIQRNKISSATLSISNITQNTSHLYYYSITASTTKPSIDLGNSDNQLKYSSENKAFIKEISSYVELNQDLYLWVVEKDGSNSHYVVEGKKLDRPKYPKYSDVFFATLLSNSGTQILFNVPWSEKTVRKINVKIGEISDSSILNKIKNNESDAFENLLKFSKTATTIYNKTLTSNRDTFFGQPGGYNVDRDEPGIIDLSSSVIDAKYYFLYAELDDENGKYYPVEGITLAKSSRNEFSNISNINWTLFFLGSDSFSWDLFEDIRPTNPTTTKPSTTPSPTDTTTSKKSIPFAGNKTFIITSIVVLMLFAIIGELQYKKYKGIK